MAAATCSRSSKSAPAKRSATPSLRSSPVKASRSAPLFQIFSVIVEHHHSPLFLPIEMELDLEKRRGRISVPSVVRSSAEPIRNPVTDEEHRMLTILPDAWMYYEHENIAGDAKGLGDIKFDYTSRHASLARFAYNNNGLAYNCEEHVAKYGLG